MNIDWSEWGPPLAVVAGGLAVGGMLLSRARNTPDAAVIAEGQRDDLAQSRASAIEALRALELEKDRMDPVLYQQERTALLARGSNALRKLEEADLAVEAPIPATELAAQLADARRRAGPAAFAAAAREVAPELRTAPRPAVAPEWKGAGFALAACALVALLFNMAQDDSVARREGASMTGNQDLGSAPAGPAGVPPQAAAIIAELDAKIAANPSDVVALNELTGVYLQLGDATKAMEANRKVIGIDEKNLDARTSRGVLAATVQMFDKALAEFDSVLAEDPKHGRANAYRGLILLELDRAPEAVTSLEAALQAEPGNMNLMRALGRAREIAGGGAAAPPAAAGPVELIVSGTVTLDPAKAATLTGKETLYVSIADPAQPRPPLAALKLAPGPFPQKIEVTSANVISMGGPRPVPATVSVTVRIDVDGNPLTQDHLATWTQAATAKGTADLAIVLE